VASCSTSDNGIGLLASAAYEYLSEIEKLRSLCERHAKSTAIHEKGNGLQVYKMFPRERSIASSIHRTTKTLCDWNTSQFWQPNRSDLEKVERDIRARLTKHKKLDEILTKGVAWESRPILIHAYKFQTDSCLKVELVILEIDVPELSLHTIASALRLHEYLVPDYIAHAKPPYERHECAFATIWEYLWRTMPKELYATQCFPQTNGNVP
jgi:hypothetical protein